ncbi:uncharacterized protein LOC131253470 [Magnolia sinica]|uniref:uncharacterized protein LOC131253470 n=1 Tax=Magnolia sinica TaxID=86752 RepID=UPI002657B68A|nr:uncharacterized protein LOC131253470 [Magnolia sinica]
MEPKSISVQNLLVRILVFGFFILLLRFVYVFTVQCDGQSNFCFFSGPGSISILGAGGIDGAHYARSDGPPLSSPPSPKSRPLWRTGEWRRIVDFYSAVFHDLIADGYLSPASRALCVDTRDGPEVYAMRDIGISDSIGIHKKASLPLVVSGDSAHHPFDENTFDFIFTAGGADRAARPGEFADEVRRMLRPEGYLVVHTSSAKDLYSLNSFQELFNCCRLVRSREIDGPDSTPAVREIVMKKDTYIHSHGGLNPAGDSVNKCPVPAHRRELVWNAEPLIAEEPLKPWITLKRNIKNIKYLPSMADINFKRRYVYVDVGARSYGSSIGSWFKKQYPKQNRTFEMYAIEADRAFHDEYKAKKGIELLPYAAWVRNETLSFEINRDPGKKSGAMGRGMGRIQPVGGGSSAVSGGDVDRIQGFDFASWLKSAVSEKDFVVMKMDIEGTEFDLIPRLFETGAICLIDELFLECHYNRWQRCCPGERSSKYQKTYNQCLELFSSMRESGVLVHQWW